jgi:hypothetical protein
MMMEELYTVSSFFYLRYSTDCVQYSTVCSLLRREFEANAMLRALLVLVHEVVLRHCRICDTEYDVPVLEPLQRETYPYSSSTYETYPLESLSRDDSWTRGYRTLCSQI